MRKVLLLLGVAATFAVVAAVAFANHPGPISPNADSLTFVAGNPTCPGNTIAAVKVDPGANGLFAGFISVTNYNGTTFDWELLPGSGWDMAAVIVKGGPNANIYWYDFAGAGTDNSDTGLHAPVNHNNDKFYGISHIQFCVDPKGGGDN